MNVDQVDIWAGTNSVEIADTSTHSSWLNRIEVPFWNRWVPSGRA
ncbi:hypothetical protein [Streptomyces sp. NPDC102360]